MKLKRLNFLVGLLSLLVLFLAGRIEAGTLPRVLVLATGGTIAGAANGNSDTGYSAGQLGIEEIIKSAPGIDSLPVSVKAEQVVNISSQDMNFEVWRKLAMRISQAVENEEADGFVITHGTDTMEETAFFLSQVLDIDNPVVFVGSMRPATQISADGPQNLLDAIKTASCIDSFGRGVMICFNGRILDARHAVKASCLEVTAFDSTIGGSIGFTDGHGVHYITPGGLHKHKTYKLDFTKITELPKTDVIYICADMDGGMIRDCVKRGAKGVVIAGVGDGNMPEDCLKACKEVSAQGVQVVRSSRVFQGYTHRDHEFKDADYGTYAAYDLNPAKARILLQLLLACKVSDPQKIQAAFNGDRHGVLYYIEK
ncbi:asparaginase [bacterium]|nr:asparaginase [bacterium]